MQKLSTKNIALAIYAATKDKTGLELERALENSVEFLAKKNLLSKSPEILKHLKKAVHDGENTVEAKVLSPRPLGNHATSEVKQALKKRYKAEDIILDLEEDKSLIGGIRIEARDEVIDLSLKNRLDKLQAHLLAN